MLLVGLEAILGAKSTIRLVFSLVGTGLARLRALPWRLPLLLFFAAAGEFASHGRIDACGFLFSRVRVSAAIATKIKGNAKQLARGMSKTTRHDAIYPIAAVTIRKLMIGEWSFQFAQAARVIRIHAPSKQLQPASCQ
jgi:hypothetical protein